MKQILFFILLISTVVPLLAQHTIETVVSQSTVATQERFEFEIVINNANCQVFQPDFGGLEVTGGPYSSQNNSIQIINGVQTKTNEYRWKYQLLSKTEGDFTIAAVSMDCDGEEVKSEPIKITVTNNASTSNADKDYYMKLSLNKSSVYAGEPFIASLKYYAKLRPDSFNGLDLGDAVGIYRQDLHPDRTSFQTSIERINGMRYYTIELREELCFAQRSGTVTLESYYAALVFSQGFFNRFQKETYSNSATINVKKIPNSDTKNFNGLVGDFSISSELSHDHVLMGDAIDITITIDGKGNMQELGNIVLDIPVEFDQFDPTIEDATKVSRSGISGKIEYNFVIIPKHYGNYTIPGYSFTYFDLKSKKMKTVSTEDFTIKVDKREGVDIESPDLPTEDTEIRYIEEESDSFFDQDSFLFGSWTYFLLLITPILLALLFLFFKRKKDNLSEDDLLKIKQKKAVKIAQNQLIEIRNNLNNGEDKLALKGVHDMLIQFFKQKFNVGLSDVSKREINKRLKEKNIDQATTDNFNQIWDKIEMGQFAPIPHENIVQTVDNAEILIIELDKKI